jgi:response regulator RpfG family c-di-GMP phosphodiesterase
MTGESQVVEQSCVLVVDDEQDILETLSEVVEMAGCSALLASNGAEALKILNERLPCLMIVDMRMPVMDGNELIDAMKKQPTLAKVPVLISTSFPHAAPVGIPVVRKPIDINVVWDWMRRTCRCAPHNHPGVVQ